MGVVVAVGAPMVAPAEAPTATPWRGVGQRVEIVAQRTETGRVFANPDGTFTLEQRARPVRVRRGAGWVGVDTTLTIAGDGRVVPRAAAVELAFSGGGRSQPLATVGRDGKQLSLHWPHSLPKPVLKANTATYRDVIEGVDLRVTADVEGFQEVLVVKSREAARQPALKTIRFTTTTKGLTTHTDKAGNLDAKEAGGEVVVHGPAPEMWDSGNRRALVATKHGRGALTLTPDRGLLDDPRTKYPVYIDPPYGAGRSAWTYISRQFPAQEYWNSSDAAPSGYYNDPDSYPTVDTKRSFFRMNTSPVNGKHILSATFRTWENWAWSCNARPVQLWITSGISSATNWNNPPALQRLIREVNVAKGYNSSCNDGGVDFEAKSAVEEAASKGWSSLTLGLKAANESDTFGWKKFNNNPTLEITYNTVPGVPDQLSTDPATACATGAGRPFTGDLTPTLKARITDADNSVRARFEWWTPGGAMVGSATTALSTSGIVRQATVPAGALKDGGTYAWRVRAEDGTDTSTWSAWCELSIDATLPSQRPGVTSTDFPEEDWGGRVGEPGTVTFTAGGGTDVSGYVYSLNQDPPSTPVNAGALGGPATVTLVPDKYGPNTLRVRVRDRAGNLGPIKLYVFFANAGLPPAGAWSLDDGTGIAVTGSPIWVDGRSGPAIRFNGSTTAASTTTPVIRTDQSYSVAAWVRLNGTRTWANVLAQAGTRVSAVNLHAGTGGGNRWGLTVHSADSDSPTATRALSASQARLGTWTHLTGVYDAQARELRLYVDGVLAGTAPYTSTWNATGQFLIGRSLWKATAGDHFPGDIDEVKAWQRVVSPEEIAGLASLTARPKGDWNFDEGGGPTNEDWSGNGNTVTMSGTVDWTTGRTPESGTALTLDGTGGQAATRGPVVRTDQPFTVSAWVRLHSKGAYRTAVSQDGTAFGGFFLQYQPGDHYRFAMVDADVGAPTATYAASAPAPPQLNAWTHLTGVYDPASKQVRLYVNGELVATGNHPGAWNATGPLRVGGSRTGDPWDGDIDDVRIWPEVVSDYEIRTLADRRPAQAARWKLTEGTGTTASDDTGNGNTAVLQGGATWGVGPTGVAGTALELNGSTGYAITAGPVLRTDQSFTVSARVKLTAAGDWRTAVCQATTNICAFYLQYDKNLDRLRLVRPDTTASTAGGSANSTGPPQLNVWTHLTGVYDAGARQVRFYRNGVLEGSAASTGTLNSTGRVQLGRAAHGSAAVNFFAGGLSDVRLYRGALTTDEVFQLSKELP